MQRDQKHVKIGFTAFQEFYKRRMNTKTPTYEAFSKSTLYSAFVRFGRYVCDINAINVTAFLDFLIRSDIGIDDWESPKIYKSYVRALTANESPIDALDRNLLLMQQWAMTESEDWTDFFRKVSPAQATLWVESGRISPWIWFLASSVAELLVRMTDEQNEIVGNSFDQSFWSHKIALHDAEVAMIRQELEAEGI